MGKKKINVHTVENFNPPTQNALVTGQIYIFQLAQVKFCKVVQFICQISLGPVKKM